MVRVPAWIWLGLWFREAVEEELSRDPLIDAAGITVRTIDGNVALGG